MKEKFKYKRGPVDIVITIVGNHLDVAAKGGTPEEREIAVRDVLKIVREKFNVKHEGPMLKLVENTNES